MSNAAKNLFGTIPGTIKPEYHYRFPDPDDFANMLVDLNEYFKPRLAICDGILAMEGNGPTMGTPRKMNLVAASRSTHMLDLVCAKLLGLSKDDVPTLRAAYKRGLIPASADDLLVQGKMDEFCQPDFDTPIAQGPVTFPHKFRGPFGKIMARLASAALTCRPQVKKPLCVGCGKCASICPAKAITMKNKLPEIDRAKCIHCFCCQEFCPKGAMQVYRPLPARLLNKQAR
jgi:ferredoxin